VLESCCCEKLVAEASDSSGAHRKGNVCRWKLLPSSDSEDMTMDTCVCAHARACMRVWVHTRACMHDSEL
jgi:hypothetical protein